MVGYFARIFFCGDLSWLHSMAMPASSWQRVTDCIVAALGKDAPQGKDHYACALDLEATPACDLPSLTWKKTMLQEAKPL